MAINFNKVSIRFKASSLIVFLVLIFCSCRQSENKDVLRLVAQPLNVSQYIDTASMLYTVLEYTPDCIIGRLQQLLVNDDYIFVVNYRPNVVYMFDRSGKFIRQIGKLGRGPQEYLSIQNIDVNQEQQEIMVYDSKLGKVMIYDYAGKLLRTFRNDASGDIVQLSPSLYAIQNFFDNAKIPQNPKVVVMDSSGKIIKTFIHKPDDINKDSGGVPVSDGFFSKNKSGVYYIPYGEDKIYRLSLEGFTNEEILSLGIQAYMMPMHVTSEEYFKLQGQKLGPLGELCVTDEGVFTATLNFDNLGVLFIGSLESSEKVMGIAMESPDLPGTPVNTYHDYFIGLISAADAFQFKDKFPNIEEDANPVVVFFKYKLP